MQLRHTFAVGATPDATFAFLLDVNRVATCIPGISAVEERDPGTFVGTLRVKVGPVGVTYRGQATITSLDAGARRATIAAEGTEGVGAGGVTASAAMAVDEAGDGSTVTIVTDVAIAGRLAQFGRGIIESVSNRIVGQMADCVRQQLESNDPGAAPGSANPG